MGLSRHQRRKAAAAASGEGSAQAAALAVHVLSKKKRNLEHKYSARNAVFATVEATLAGQEAEHAENLAQNVRRLLTQ